MSSVDLEADSLSTGSSSMQFDFIGNAPNPTRLIFQRNGLYTGGRAMGGGYSGFKDTQQWQDTNPANVTGNTQGYLATYLHNFILENPFLLHDLNTQIIYDLRATDSNTLLIFWPPR